MFRFFKLILTLAMAVLILGCASKNKEIYGLSPDKWQQLIIKDIKRGYLDDADKHYASFASEHISSPLLEATLLILARAHSEKEEYILANHFLDEYLRRYGDGASKSEYASYLKLRANFNSFTQPDRNEKLILDSIAGLEKFIFTHPASEFRPLVEQMLLRFKLARYYLQKQIYELYERTGKDESANIYKQRLEDSAFKNAEITAPKLAWYRKIFN